MLMPMTRPSYQCVNYGETTKENGLRVSFSISVRLAQSKSFIKYADLCLMADYFGLLL